MNKETAGNIVFAKGGVEYIKSPLVFFSRSCFSYCFFLNFNNLKKHLLRLVEIELSVKFSPPFANTFPVIRHFTKKMTEQKLKEYFENKITIDELKSDVKNSQTKIGFDTTNVYIKQIDEGEFEVQKEHLIKLCDDFIAQKLDSEDLNTIAFSLIASEYFDWNGDEMSNVIFDWDNPIIGYDINLKNVQLWKDYLENGNYNLDKNELKEKFRSKGKFLNLYQQIDQILWEDWDPIGINDDAPRDEYQGYTPIILKLVKSKSDSTKIAEKLYEIETESIGLSGNYKNCLKVAEKITNLEKKNVV